jgi:hypothetical protein
MQQPILDTGLDAAIRKKREALKLHKMTNVFDAFGEEKKEVPVEKQTVQEQNNTVFDRLDAISRKDAFEELEIVSRKEGKGLKTNEKDIDNLIKGK